MVGFSCIKKDKFEIGNPIVDGSDESTNTIYEFVIWLFVAVPEYIMDWYE
jgi:hypothetical protein